MMAVLPPNCTKTHTKPNQSRFPKASLLAMSSLLLSASVLLGGCQATKGWLSKYDDGSLNYQSSKKLDPIKLPANQETANFTPLYPTPKLGVNTLNLKNAAGKQYQLPKPERAVKPDTTNMQTP